MLLNFLDTDLHARQGKAITNFSSTLPAPESELAQQLTKGPYQFDFLTISETYKEKELKDALVSNITRLLMERKLLTNDIVDRHAIMRTYVHITAKHHRISLQGSHRHASGYVSSARRHSRANEPAHA